MAFAISNEQPVGGAVSPLQLSPDRAVEGSNTLLYDYGALLRMIQGTREDREQILTEIKNDTYKVEGKYTDGEVLPQLAQKDLVYTIGTKILKVTQLEAEEEVEPALNLIVALMKKIYFENRRILSEQHIDPRDKEKLEKNQGMLRIVLLSELPENDELIQQLQADIRVVQEETAGQIGKVCYWGTAGVTTVATGVEVASTVEAGGSVAASIAGGSLGTIGAVAAPLVLPIVAKKRKWSTRQIVFAAIAVPSAVLLFGATGPVMLLTTGGIIAINELAGYAKEKLDARQQRSKASEGSLTRISQLESELEISTISLKKFFDKREIQVKGKIDRIYYYIPRKAGRLSRPPRHIKIKKSEKQPTRKWRG